MDEMMIDEEIIKEVLEEKCPYLSDHEISVILNEIAFRQEKVDLEFEDFLDRVS